MNVLSISLDNSLLDPNSEVFARHRFYASCVNTYQVIVFTLRSNKKKKIIDKNLFIVPTDSENKLFSIFDAIKIAKELKKNTSFDLVTCQDPFATGVAGVFIKWILKIPLNVQIHSDFFGSKYFREESWFNRLLYFVGRIVLTQADSVRGRNKRIGGYYIPQRINNVFLEPLTHKKRDRNLIISTGRIVKQKNFPLLIQAVTRVQQSFPELKLLIVGDGTERRNLKLNKGIEVLGWKKPQEIRNLLDKASIFVLSSNHEGWGLVCLEALARGTPVVMTDTGCAGEIVINNKTGIVAPVGDANKLADGIVSVIKNPKKYQKMALQGRKLVLQDSSTRKIKNDMLNLFNLTAKSCCK